MNFILSLCMFRDPSISSFLISSSSYCFYVSGLVACYNSELTSEVMNPLTQLVGLLGRGSVFARRVAAQSNINTANRGHTSTLNPTVPVSNGPNPRLKPRGHCVRPSLFKMKVFSSGFLKGSTTTISPLDYNARSFEKQAKFEYL
jgi:hypothetical protein